jgi:hypothetical protein
VFQRWGFAAVQGVLGLGLLLAGTMASDAALGHKAVGDAFRIVLWSAAFIACLVAIVAFAGQAVAELIGASLPYLAALWLLVLGARFATRRAPVIAIAVIAGLLLLFQCAFFGAQILLSPYNLALRTQFQALLGVTVVTGVACIWWFLRAKRPTPAPR